MECEDTFTVSNCCDETRLAEDYMKRTVSAFEGAAFALQRNNVNIAHTIEGRGYLIMSHQLFRKPSRKHQQGRFLLNARYLTTISNPFGLI